MCRPFVHLPHLTPWFFSPRSCSFCVATHPEAEEKLLAELKQAGLPCDGDLEAALTFLESKGPDGLSPEVRLVIKA